MVTGPIVQIHRDDIAGLQGVAEARGGVAGIKFAGGDGVAKEGAGEAFGQDKVAAGGAEGDGSVFARAAAAKIAAGDDDGILALGLPRLDEADRIEGVGQTGEGVAAEGLVFGGDGGDEVEVLRGDDLVGVNVVAHDVNRPGKNRLHGRSVPEAAENSRLLLEGNRPPRSLATFWERDRPGCIRWRLADGNFHPNQITFWVQPVAVVMIGAGPMRRMGQEGIGECI